MSPLATTRSSLPLFRRSTHESPQPANVAPSARVKVAPTLAYNGPELTYAASVWRRELLTNRSGRPSPLMSAAAMPIPAAESATFAARAVSTKWKPSGPPGSLM